MTIVSFHFQILDMIRLSTLCIALALCASAWSSSLNVEGSSKRLLVLVDTLGIRESHSFYFKQLTGERISYEFVIEHSHCFLSERGFEITYKSSDDATLEIVKYGEYLYDHIIIFAPSTKGKTLAVTDQPASSRW